MRAFLIGLGRVGLVCALLAVPACKQDEGERCEVNEDCGDGLECQYRTRPEPGEGGICRVPGGTTPVVDAGPDVPATDAPSPDGPTSEIPAFETAAFEASGDL